MPYAWEERFEAEFAGEEALLQLLPYFCACEPGARCRKHDTVTDTVIILLTKPLHLALTEVGAMPFYGASTLLYPYNLMTERQKAFVRGCLERRDEWNIYNDAVVFRRSKGQRTLSPPAVLLALCHKVFESRAHADPARRMGLCNIILQRVQGYVRIDKEVQRALNEWLASRSADAAPAPYPPEPDPPGPDPAPEPEPQPVPPPRLAPPGPAGIKACV
jgi:hypothetical protein